MPRTQNINCSPHEVPLILPPEPRSFVLLWLQLF